MKKQSKLAMKLAYLLSIGKVEDITDTQEALDLQQHSDLPIEVVYKFTSKRPESELTGLCLTNVSMKNCINMLYEIHQPICSRYK